MEVLCLGRRLYRALLQGFGLPICRSQSSGIQHPQLARSAQGTHVTRNRPDDQFHPSYPSAKALTDDILSDPTDEKDIMKIRSAPFQPQMQEIMKTLPELKKDRPHGPKAVQSAHDLTANSSKSSRCSR